MLLIISRPFIFLSKSIFITDPHDFYNLITSVFNIKMSEYQRDTPTVHSHSNQYQNHQEESAQKKKLIKKEKTANKSQATNKLTKQERMKIQKEKNREAAQRSRDQHKQYVNNLENQIKLLKEQLEQNKSYCSRCKRQLNNQDRFFEQGLENQLSFEQHRIFQKQQTIQDQPLQKDDKNDLPLEEDYFLRIKNQDEDFSYLKMMLFIAMIAIGVFLYPSGTEVADSSRHLVQVYQSPISKSIIMDDFTINANDTPNSHQNPSEMFVDYNNGLVVRNSVINQQCLDSLIEDQSLSLANLRTSIPAFENQMSGGILLCSFEQHKGPVISSNSEKSAFVRMFLMGAEIKEMVTANSPIKKFIENNLQLNGIYRVAAQVKQIELISQHNCLL